MDNIPQEILFDIAEYIRNDKFIFRLQLTCKKIYNILIKYKKFYFKKTILPLLNFDYKILANKYTFSAFTRIGCYLCRNIWFDCSSIKAKTRIYIVRGRFTGSP